MAEYLHDEWCATNLDASPECDCVRKLLLDKDAQLATLEQRVERLEDVIRREADAVQLEYPTEAYELRKALDQREE